MGRPVDARHSAIGSIAVPAVAATEKHRADAASIVHGETTMQYGLISLFPDQIARVLGLVRSVSPVRLAVGKQPVWALLINGRGFTRLLRNARLVAPGLIRPANWRLHMPGRSHYTHVATHDAHNQGQ